MIPVTDILIYFTLSVQQCVRSIFRVAAQGGATLNYFMYSLVVWFSDSQPLGQAPSRGHKINLWSREMINGRGKKKKQLCYTNLCCILHFSWISAFLLSKLFIWNTHLEGKSGGCKHLISVWNTTRSPDCTLLFCKGTRASKDGNHWFDL